ncbi:hypothetical protein EDD11_009305 [Mortierella claussenii]|nr:hypothetical protein EDD11_009305 [Mortierella claussenii]
MTMMTDRVYLVASMEYLISVVGNQVVVRGKESDIVYDIINALQEVLPKDCCSVILDGSSYEPSYMCNILGLDRSVSIPPDLDPQDFILLDICTQESGQHIATPTISLPTNSNDQQHGPKNTTPIYQASWSSATLVADMKCLSSCLEKTAVTDGAQWSASVIDGKPQSSARIFLLQAGEEPPLASRPNFGDLNGRDILSRRTVSPQILSYPLFIETVNDILDYKMPRIIESKRLAVLREEWISKSLQFHNLYKTGKASDESLVDGFLQSMRVDKRDLKILRFFTRCAKSSSMQPQKYRNEELMCN